MKTSKEILEMLQTSPEKANMRKPDGPYTIALYDGADAIPDEYEHEKRALYYLADNPAAFIDLRHGDKVITNALKIAIRHM